MKIISKREKKYFEKLKPPLTDLPNIVSHQTESFKWFIEKGLAEVFKEFSPIKDYAGKKFELSFSAFEILKPKYDEHYSKDNNLSYDGQLKIKVKLRNKILSTEKEQEIFLTDIPLMTDHGTFIINGIERVIVPQLARSFGVFFTGNEIKGKKYFGAKIIPARGAWVEIESDADDLLYVKIDKKRKFSIISLLRVLGASDKEILEYFKSTKLVLDDDLRDIAIKAMDLNLSKDHAKHVKNSYKEIKKLFS